MLNGRSSVLTERRFVATLCLAAVLAAAAVPFASGLVSAVIVLAASVSVLPSIPVEPEQASNLQPAPLVRATSLRAPPVTA
jgi:NADH:ubiquinone oxidoreductase subunit 4 (subunit M)